MRVIVVGREDTEYAHDVADWMRDFERATGREAELLDPDSREGESLRTTYDIVEYPTIIVLEEGMGRMVGMWRGKHLPQIDEITYLL